MKYFLQKLPTSLKNQIGRLIEESTTNQKEIYDLNLDWGSSNYKEPQSTYQIKLNFNNFSLGKVINLFYITFCYYYIDQQNPNTKISRIYYILHYTFIFMDLIIFCLKFLFIRNQNAHSKIQSQNYHVVAGLKDVNPKQLSSYDAFPLLIQKTENELKVGQIIHLSEGEKAPADLLILESLKFQILIQTIDGSIFLRECCNKTYGKFINNQSFQVQPSVGIKSKLFEYLKILNINVQFQKFEGFVKSKMDPQAEFFNDKNMIFKGETLIEPQWLLGLILFKREDIKQKCKKQKFNIIKRIRSQQTVFLMSLELLLLIIIFIFQKNEDMTNSFQNFLFLSLYIIPTITTFVLMLPNIYFCLEYLFVQLTSFIYFKNQENIGIKMSSFQNKLDYKPQFIINKEIEQLQSCKIFLMNIASIKKKLVAKYLLINRQLINLHDDNGKHQIQNLLQKNNKNQSFDELNEEQNDLSENNDLGERMKIANLLQQKINSRYQSKMLDSVQSSRSKFSNANSPQLYSPSDQKLDDLSLNSKKKVFFQKKSTIRNFLSLTSTFQQKNIIMSKEYSKEESQKKTQVQISISTKTIINLLKDQDLDRLIIALIVCQRLISEFKTKDQVRGGSESILNRNYHEIDLMQSDLLNQLNCKIICKSNQQNKKQSSKHLSEDFDNNLADFIESYNIAEFADGTLKAFGIIQIFSSKQQNDLSVICYDRQLKEYFLVSRKQIINLPEELLSEENSQKVQREINNFIVKGLIPILYCRTIIEENQIKSIVSNFKNIDQLKIFEKEMQFIGLLGVQIMSNLDNCLGNLQYQLNNSSFRFWITTSAQLDEVIPYLYSQNLVYDELNLIILNQQSTNQIKDEFKRIFMKITENQNQDSFMIYSKQRQNKSISQLYNSRIMDKSEKQFDNNLEILKDTYFIIQNNTLNLIMSDDYLKCHFQFLILFNQGICFYETNSNTQEQIINFIKFTKSYFMSVSLFGEDHYQHKNSLYGIHLSQLNQNQTNKSADLSLKHIEQMIELIFFYSRAVFSFKLMFWRFFFYSFLAQIINIFTLEMISKFTTYSENFTNLNIISPCFLVTLTLNFIFLLIATLIQLYEQLNEFIQRPAYLLYSSQFSRQTKILSFWAFSFQIGITVVIFASAFQMFCIFSLQKEYSPMLIIFSFSILQKALLNQLFFINFFISALLFVSLALDYYFLCLFAKLFQQNFYINQELLIDDIFFLILEYLVWNIVFRFINLLQFSNFFQIIAEYEKIIMVKIVYDSIMQKQLYQQLTEGVRKIFRNKPIDPILEKGIK